MADPVIGIDLGTTNSVVATVKDGKVVVITDDKGRRLHPSIVSFHPNGGTLVSYEAQQRRIVDPRNTIFSAKRLIGQPYRSEDVQYAIQRLPYRVEEGPNEQTVIVARGKRYTVPEISALVLAYLRQCAERHFGGPVDKAVITVPANFNDSQRAATKAAGRIAGLEVLRILNEPTAAALAYGVGRGLDRKIAIYDLGGGTFDITILQVRDKIFEVLATGGDTFLGGDDMDEAMLDLLALDFLADHHYDLRDDMVARPVLLVAAEHVKRQLSKHERYQSEIKDLIHGEGGAAIALKIDVARDRFEQAIEPLCERTFEACEEVIRLAGLEVSQIDDVVLVGGATRVPLVQRSVEKYFQKPVHANINPDEVVAYGAAIQALALSSDLEMDQFYSLLLDVTPRALGIAVAGGYAEPIIGRNVQIPVEQTRIFTTASDHQQLVRIQVCQGESRRFDENTALGELALSDLRRARRGEIKIAVTFLIDTDGILRVNARDVDTGAAQTATIQVRGTMSEQEIGERRAAFAVTSAQALPAPAENAS
ncbi:MAG TPA: Hsp70 family protein [Polyangia bacterium]|nr:Hsp70 family protein [Polyangia bacterium]